MSLQEYLKNKRIEKKMTMAELAKKVGVSEATISRWESGDIANMKRDKIFSLANALQISPLEIMFPVTLSPEDEELRDFLNAAKKFPQTPHNNLPKDYEFLKKALNYCNCDLVFEHNRYTLIHEDGFFEIDDDKLKKLFNSIIDYTNYTVHRLIVENTNNLFSEMSTESKNDFIKKVKSIKEQK